MRNISNGPDIRRDERLPAQPAQKSGARRRTPPATGASEAARATICGNCGGEQTGVGYTDRAACLNFCGRGCVREFYGEMPRQVTRGAYAL